jgi:subtilisin-like proprotein convertase family protein
MRFWIMCTLVACLLLAGCRNKSNREVFVTDAPFECTLAFALDPISLGSVTAGATLSDSTTLVASTAGGVPPFTYTGSFPAGANLSISSTGVMTSGPGGVGSPGVYSATVVVSDSTGRCTDSTTVTLIVVSSVTAVTFSSPSPLAFTVGSGAVTITTTGSPSGGVISLSNASPGTTGGVFTLINASAGTFSFSASSAGTASINVTYTLPTGASQTITYVVNVTGGGGGGTPGQFNRTPALNVVTSAVDTLSVTGIGTIVDLDVMLDIPHTFSGDMDVTLTSPASTNVILVDGVTSNGLNDVLANILLSDGSPALSTAVEGGQNFARFSPTNPLSAFNGESANGTWTLNIVDNFPASDEGCLQAWALLFNGVTFVDPGQVACAGTATLSFTPASPGSFTIGGVALNVALTGSPTGGAFTLDSSSTTATGGSFALTGSTLSYSGGTTAGTATATVTYTVTGSTPATATYSVIVTAAGAATLSFSPTSPGSFTIGGADLNVTLTGTPTGGAFTLDATSTTATGGSFSLTGSTLTYSGGTTAGTATATVTYTVTGFTPATATYSVSVSGGGGGGTPGQFSRTPGLDVVTSASDTLAVTGIGTIFDLNVMLDIPHAYTSDMEITLTSPSTTSVLIVDSAGSSNDDVLVDIILSDGSPALSTAVAGGQGFGLFAPSNPLSAFNTQSADGTWALDVVDTFTGSDDGCLQAWALLFNSVTFTDPGQTACGGGGTATLSFSPTSPGSFTIGGADLNVTLTGTPTGGAFTLGRDFNHSYRRKFQLNGFDFDLFGWNLCWNGYRYDVTYTVTGFTPATATYSVSVSGGGGGGTPGQFSRTPGLDVVTSASDTLAVTGIGTIFDLDVMLDIPHAYTSDMEITLTSPSTTSVLIVDSVGSSNDDVLVDIILSDGSPALSTAVAGGQGFGLFAPSNPLSAFNSQSADGTWALDVVDTFTGSDDGCLQAWALLFNSVTFVLTPVKRLAGVVERLLYPLARPLRVALLSGERI